MRRLMPANEITLLAAIEAFFADRDLAANSRRSYRRVLNALITDHSADLAMSTLTPAKVRRTLVSRWDESAPTTWNARITALQSFVGYCDRNGWIRRNPLRGIERRREPRDDTKALAYDDLDKLRSRPDVGLREKTLWRMLYETAARTNEILSLDIEDLDLARKRAVVIGKGGHREMVVWASGTARLLPRYLNGRRRGPVFVTSRQPNVAPADQDRCPGHRPWPAVISDGLEAVQPNQQRRDPASAAALSTHPPRRRGSLRSAPASQEPSPRSAHPRPLLEPGIEAVAALTADHDRGRRHRR